MKASTRVRCRVLLADDTPEIRQLVRMALELEGGFEIVGEAGNGVEALSLSADHRPDAIVLDLAMPVMDGLEAIPAIKRDSPATKILVLSGFNAAQMCHEAMAAGADGYVEKGEPAARIIQLLYELCPPPLDPDTEEEPTPAAAPPSTVAALAAEEDRSVSELSSLAHELMTPVTVVQGFAETMADRAELLEPAVIKEWAHTIARNASNMAAIIRSFRETARLESGQVDLDLKVVELRRTTAEVVADLAGPLGDRPVTIEGLDALEVYADLVKVRQILSNLISNAAKFSPADSPIEVTLVKGLFYGEVSIRDHGRGIDPGLRESLFRRFSRLDAPEPGSGLGLYISRHLARAHGGDVVHKNEGSGGATFCVRLPLPL